MPNARRLVEATGGAQNRTPAWRRALDWRTPGWCHEAGVHWESWSLNGEACITGLDPPFAGGARLASCLTWLVRVLAEERQVFVPARAATLAAGVHRAWARGLEAVARVDGAAVTGLLDDDEHAFLLNMMVRVHARPATNAQPRPPLDESYQRHEGLIAELAPSAQATGLPVAWHALWRLPPAMTWTEPGGKPWIRYPAVSFVAAVRPLQ